MKKIVKAFMLVMALTMCVSEIPGFAIQPAEAAVSPGATLQLMAVNAPAPIVWAVAENGGGTITQTGLYTAPGCTGLGTWHVVASSGSASAQATVTVTDAGTTGSVTISPTTLNIPPGGTGQFTATVLGTCGTVQSVQTTTVTAPKATTLLRK